MNNLLTSQDLLRVEFKKTMRGYDTSEVDQFLDMVSETLQRYAERTKNLEQEILKNRERLDEFEKLREVMHDTLLVAQKTADEKISQAKAEAEKIIADAMAKAENVRADCYAENRQLCDELARIKAVRNDYMAEAKSMLSRFDKLLCECAKATEVGAQADEAIQNAKAQMPNEKQIEIVSDETISAACDGDKTEELKETQEVESEELVCESSVRFEYEKEPEPVEAVQDSLDASETEEFQLYDSAELIKADACEPPCEKSEEELSAEQLARAEKTAFTDENQSNLFGEAAEPMRLSREIHYAQADDIDE